MNRHLQQVVMVLSAFSLLLFMAGCGATDENNDESVGVTGEAVISATAANNLINAGRAQLGTYGGQCKTWAQNVTLSSYGVTLAQNDTSPLSDQYKWVNDSTPATNMARWLGSYANGRSGPQNVAANSSITPVTVSIPNSDPQILVVYASITNVTATLTKGSTVISATTAGIYPTGGITSGNAVFGSGNATLTVRNNSTTASAAGVVAVVLSYSRFQSDWQTARRGDIMQMYVGTSQSDRSVGGPHTAFIQTDFNANGTTSCSGAATQATNTEGCNWLDSNWAAPQDGLVRAHNMTMDSMMRMAAYSSLYGFTVYRLN